MSTLITRTSDSATTEPLLVLGFQAQHEGRSIFHKLIGGGLAVTLVKPDLRSGALELLYADEADALAAEALHTAKTTFALTSSVRPGIEMAYVVNGDGVSIGLDPETRYRWLVTVGFQEVIL